MKKTLLTLFCAALAVGVWAAETPQKPSFSGFVSNGFWDNWEISGGIGVGTALSNGRNFGRFGDRLGFVGDLSVTKWYHPIIGSRLQLQGGYYNSFYTNQNKMTWPYIFLHADLMINASNWIGGYRDDRAWQAVPFVGFGYMAADITDQSQRKNQSGCLQELALTYGLLNKFRLSPAVDFNLELKGLFAKSGISPQQMQGDYLSGFSLTAGFTYRFNRRGWQRAEGYSADQIRAYQQANENIENELEALKAESAALKKQLQNQPKPTYNNPTTIIIDGYNESKLTPAEMANLDELATQIKNGPRERVYRIETYQGKNEAEQAQARKRARTVYYYLIEQGVNPDQILFDGKIKAEK